MAFPVHRDDITIHGISSGGFLGLRWHRLLFPSPGMPFVHYGVELGTAAAVHFGPATSTDVAQARLNQLEPILDTPTAGGSIVLAAQDPVGLAAANSTDGAAATTEDGASAIDQVNPFLHPPFSLPSPLSAAFLPPDSDDLSGLPHGPDLAFAFTPPPLPPPPDTI